MYSLTHTHFFFLLQPCSSQYEDLDGIEGLQSTKQQCASQNINQNNTIYTWEISEDGSSFTVLNHKTLFADTHSERLDTFYLNSRIHIRCSAQAVDYAGNKGHTRTSGTVLLDKKKYMCDGSGQLKVELSSYLNFGGLDKVYMVCHRQGSDVCFH